MNPRQFEELVCEHFRNKGYEAKTSLFTGDYGVDVFATKGKEKVAIQVKMYGGGTRKINRQMVMELQGAKDYFDCTKAVIATDGVLLTDAQEVARKLRIEVLYIDRSSMPIAKKHQHKPKTFDDIWEKYIIPLQGTTLKRDNGETNDILKVNWSEIERLTSKGKKGKIKVEIFRLVINKLLLDGSISRDYINQNYVGRASSGIILILSQVPFFKLTDKPIGLRLSNDRLHDI